jgi:hypothetical protein
MPLDLQIMLKKNRDIKPTNTLLDYRAFIGPTILSWGVGYLVFSICVAKLA